jgi:small subunit ribosomal protein S1
MTMEELLASSKNTPITLSRGQEVEGEVVSIDDKEIILDLKAKSEGLISTKDVSENVLKSIKIGDKLKAFVSELENEAGLILLSLGQTSQGLGGGRWAKFSSAKQNNIQVVGKAIEVSGDGLIIEVDGIRGYLPASQMEDSTKKDQLIGSNVTIGVLEVDQNNNKLIFTQKASGADFAKIAEKYKSDQSVKGTVTKVTQFGVFVQLEKGVEGLIHVSKLGPDDNFEVGKEISVTIDSVDTNKRRISLVPTITSTKGLIYK